MALSVPGASEALLAERTAAVVWHELECGRYSADMPLWRELARECAPAPADAILDVGAGSGRVAIALAHEGHELWALEREQTLLDALCLRASAAELAVTGICGDARDFALARRDFSLCLIPMQTIQLLGGAGERVAFMRCARTHLRAGALLACAIVTALEPFDCEGDVEAAPTPEVALRDGVRYRSQALSVRVDERRVRIERRRTITAADSEASERDVIELDRLSAAELTAEAQAAGLHAHAVREIPATDEHVSSEVVIFRV
jgi:SAM-dependent methyltransferase